MKSSRPCPASLLHVLDVALRYAPSALTTVRSCCRGQPLSFAVRRRLATILGDEVWDTTRISYSLVDLRREQLRIEEYPVVRAVSDVTFSVVVSEEGEK